VSHRFELAREHTCNAFTDLVLNTGIPITSEPNDQQLKKARKVNAMTTATMETAQIRSANDKYLGTKEYVLALTALVNAAQHLGLVTYSELGDLVGIDVRTGDHARQELGLLLGAIATEEVKAGRPMLSALAVYKANPLKLDDSTPSKGFYKWACELDVISSPEEDLKLWKRERDRCYTFWRHE
jgi:hypothetical protein